MDTNRISFPEGTVAILNNGNTVITVDDHCYMLKNYDGYGWGASYHLFAEAVSIIRQLPENPDEAIVIVDWRARPTQI